jgi:hypothetical protein
MWSRHPVKPKKRATTSWQFPPVLAKQPWLTVLRFDFSLLISCCSSCFASASWSNWDSSSIIYVLYRSETSRTSRSLRSSVLLGSGNFPFLQERIPLAEFLESAVPVDRYGRSNIVMIYHDSLNLQFEDYYVQIVSKPMTIVCCNELHLCVRYY